MSRIGPTVAIVLSVVRRWSGAPADAAQALALRCRIVLAAARDIE